MFCTKELTAQAEPEMSNVLWGQGQRQPHNTAGSQWAEHSERLVHGETLPSLVSSAILGSSESPEHSLLADSLARTEAGVQGNQQGLDRAEGPFPAATGVSASSSQHGTSLTDFLHSVFQATVLISASIWGC